MILQIPFAIMNIEKWGKPPIAVKQERSKPYDSRERIIETIHNRQPDRVPVDLGATGQTGMKASTL